MNLFSDRTGSMVLVEDFGLPIAMRLGRWGNAQTMKSIVTSFGSGLAANVQFNHTLYDTIYAYVFGDRLSDFRIGGMSFASLCNAGGVSGLEMVWKYYQANKISTAGVPVTVAIGTTISYEAYLLDFSFQSNDPVFSMAQWEMRMAFHPRKK